MVTTETYAEMAVARDDAPNLLDNTKTDAHHDA
jgi:hypothetical protein